MILEINGRGGNDMKKKKRLFTKITTFALAGVLAVSMCGTGNVVKAAEEEMTDSFKIVVYVNDNFFPDENFREHIKAYDLDEDGILSEEEINKVKAIYCNNLSIESLDGIEYFENLESLDCAYNKITELDISNNKKLKYLRCAHNKIEKLNLEHNTQITTLWCSENNIDSLDVSTLTDLAKLYCSHNDLTELDISNNLKLESIDCCQNTIESLDVKNNTKLKQLDCSSNKIKELDVSNNPELIILYCYDNELTELNVKNNEKLINLDCSLNQLTELDVSNNKELSLLVVTNNNIKVINVSGNNIPEDSIHVDSSVKVVKKSVKTITLNKTQVTMAKGKALQLTANVAPADADLTTVHWTSSNESVATVDENGLVTAKAYGTATIIATAADMSGVTASCTVTVASSDVADDNTQTKTYPSVNVSYRTHIQTFGWEGKAEDIKTWKSNGTMSGTEGKAKRLEGINIVVDSANSNEDLNLGIQYTTHCQSYGWLPWSANGEMNGTEGEAKRLEAIMIQLTGADAKAYDVYYRVHAQSYGWLGWASNGAPAGTAGYGKRLEGIQIVVVKKGEDFDRTMEDIESKESKAFIAKEGNSPIVNHQPTSNTTPVVPGAQEVNVAYRTHVQSFGWQGWKYNGQMSGTSGKAKRLEGINIELRNKDCSGDIVYTTHVQTYGWQGSETDQTKWFKNGAMAGTSGEAKRLEAICINLTGDMAAKYDIYYRVHAQSYGWLGWASNGAPAGTAGFGKRLEGIQIVLVPKGGAAPTNHEGIKSVEERAYVKK